MTSTNVILQVRKIAKNLHVISHCRGINEELWMKAYSLVVTWLVHERSKTMHFTERHVL